MSKYLINKVKKLTADGVSVATDITSESVDLDNFQSVKVIVNSGKATTTENNETVETTDTEDTTAKVYAVVPDGQDVLIKTIDITLGNNNVAEIDVTANEIAHYEVKSIKVVVTGIQDSTIKCSIFALLDEARYSL